MQALPKDLNSLYEKILLGSHLPHDLRRFLLWLAFSIRPLKPEELTDVVTVDLLAKNLPSYDSDLRYFGPNDMFVTCSSFVVELGGMLLIY